MNSLFAIAPYKFQGFWVFDDPAVGLKQEPFVSGADTIIDVLTADIPDAESGFKLVFSPQPFPGYTGRFEVGRARNGRLALSRPVQVFRVCSERDLREGLAKVSVTIRLLLYGMRRQSEAATALWLHRAIVKHPRVK